MFRTVFPSSGAQNYTYTNRHMSNRYCYLLLAAGSSICLQYACCCTKSLELLMMDGKTVRNMYNVMEREMIWETGVSGWFYYSNILRCTNLWTSKLLKSFNLQSTNLPPDLLRAGRASKFAESINNNHFRPTNGGLRSELQDAWRLGRIGCPETSARN
jgi:hypothetical protein